MHLVVPPPHHPECDYTWNIHGCDRSELHLILHIVGIIAHLGVAGYGIYILHVFAAYATMSGARYDPSRIGGRRRRPFFRRPLYISSALFTAFLIVRALLFLSTVLDAVDTLAIRALLITVSFWPGFWGVLLYTVPFLSTARRAFQSMSDVAKAYPDTFAPVWVPSRLGMRLGAGLIALAGTVIPAVLARLSGQSGDRGDWDSFQMYHRASWGLWGSLLVLLGIAYGYYAFIIGSNLRLIAAHQKQIAKRTREEQDVEVDVANRGDSDIIRLPERVATCHTLATADESAGIAHVTARTSNERTVPAVSRGASLRSISQPSLWKSSFVPLEEDLDEAPAVRLTTQSGAMSLNASISSPRSARWTPPAPPASPGIVGIRYRAACELYATANMWNLSHLASSLPAFLWAFLHVEIISSPTGNIVSEVLIVVLLWPAIIFLFFWRVKYLAQSKWRQ
ncbi:hypothetical protein THASP1DRAFT_30897 [Thamnocephalis sphaerospora]|uniref:Uncharacterized protein n=1 Tax=Thamnocephalis sphaerospora TaxID=78915 RepID=A0A4V1IWE5_9FUNG|nr:hypothetical protein THASP1DRAFT_30897 [Thamnocephalis sphaerospora]|eukprot:RKP07279.1 hypothetical protein THASP1DRAFT_30897 [Thamnocephalis sphaerospora]